MLRKTILAVLESVMI
uniref:Uncharacterized protein n=1 Tax=Arundo donax TaxID=35708 RepID=A0A0A8XX65_ARUDO